MTQKKQIAILVVLLFIAGTIFWFYFHDKNAAPTDTASVIENFQLLSVENPQLHKDRLERARKSEYKSNGRNIFSAIPPPPVVKVDLNKKTEVGTVIHDPPPPAPPTLPVKFFGYGNVPNGTSRRAFFTDGEDVYIVSEGEVLMNRFRILKINNASLDFEETSSGRRGTAALEEQGAPPSA